MRSPRPSNDPAIQDTAERQQSRTSVKKMLVKSNVPVRRMDSRMKRPKASDEAMKNPLESLDREEALWYMSLPEKVQKRLFTPEEHRILKAASEVALLRIREEVNTSYHDSLSSPCIEPSMEEWDMPETNTDCSSASDYSPSTALSGLVSHRLQSPFSSQHWEEWMDHDQLPCPSRTPCAIKQSSLRLVSTVEPDFGRGRISSWLIDTSRDIDCRVAIQKSEPQYYQDPDTRTKLRQHLLTTEAFDVLLGSQFPKEIDAAQDGGLEQGTRNNSMSTPSQYSSCLPRCSTASPPSNHESSSLTSAALSEDGAVTPVSAVRKFFGPAHEGRISNSLGSAKDSTTFRMTLTQPELVRIVGEDCLPEADPWALEPLTIVNGAKGKPVPLGPQGLKRRKTLHNVVKFLRG